MRIVLCVLLLVRAVCAEPEFFPASEPVQGHVMLVAEDGQKEAAALARAGIRLSAQPRANHSRTERRFGTALDRYPPDALQWPENFDPLFVTFRNNLNLIGLGSRAPLAWQTRTSGVICIDPNPVLSNYPAPLEGPFEIIGSRDTTCMSDYIGPRAPGLPFERNLRIDEPLLLVAPGADDEICRKLKGNVHKAAGSLAEDNSALGKEVRRWIAIQQHGSVLGFPEAQFVPSPNWQMRDVGDRIDAVVVQSNGLSTLDATEKAFLDDDQRRLSTHYVVDRDGKVVQMVDERHAAWNSGPSEICINLVSHRIEEPFSHAQYLALRHIVQELRTRWALPDSAIGGKSPVVFDRRRLLRMLNSDGAL